MCVSFLGKYNNTSGCNLMQDIEVTVPFRNMYPPRGSISGPLGAETDLLTNKPTGPYRPTSC